METQKMHKWSKQKWVTSYVAMSCVNTSCTRGPAKVHASGLGGLQDLPVSFRPATVNTGSSQGSWHFFLEEVTRYLIPKPVLVCSLQAQPLATSRHHPDSTTTRHLPQWCLNVHEVKRKLPPKAIEELALHLVRIFSLCTNKQIHANNLKGRTKQPIYKQ